MLHKFGYKAPDLHSDIDLDELVRRVPADATSKGMISSGIVSLLKQRGLKLPESPNYAGKYMSFKDYPMSDFLYMASEAAALLYPYSPRREGLYKLGG